MPAEPGDLEIDDLRVLIEGRTIAEVPHLRIGPGQSLALMGPSGSGKTTILECIAGVRSPSAGHIAVGSTVITSLSARERTRLRRRSVAFVSQDPNLLDELTAVENVALPLLLDGMGARHAHERAAQLLDRVGLAALVDAWPLEMSGGERQRTNVARALGRSCSIVLADEPTAALDTPNAMSVADSLIELCRNAGVPLLIATHDARVARRCDDSCSLVATR